MATIDVDELARRLRERSIRTGSQEILISCIEGSDQEGDLTDPPNCEGFGRLRHFKVRTISPWPSNPLPILPAAYKLGLSPDRASVAQVFQNAACNWRCWYCYVPFNLLAANPKHSGWLTADAMVDLYMRESNRPKIIDCSGGQPDLVPEWVPWMMNSLQSHGIADEVYLWSDDNLSNDYFWRYLSVGQREIVAAYRNYGRVCCFKGYNAESFSFNTKAHSRFFEGQFHLFKRLLSLGIDLYAYATFTSPDGRNLAADMSAFVDRLQEIHVNLPLRLVPLRIESFGVVEPRIGELQQTAMRVQEYAVDAWNAELARRFTVEEREIPVPLVSMRGI